MNKSQAMLVLTVISMIDRRNVDEDQAQAWAQTLPDVTVEEAMTAVPEFFREPDVQVGFLFGTNWLTMGMLLSLPLIIVGIIFIIWSGRTGRTGDDLQPVSGMTEEKD